MADSKISGMTAASALTGAEVLPVVQSAANVKATTQQVVDAAMTTGLTRQALGSISTNTTIDWSAGSYVTATIGGALTFTFSNPAPTGKACVAYLQLTNGGSAAITWPVSVTWSGGTAPTLRASGVDLLRFYTQDNGTTWFGTAENDEPDTANSPGGSSGQLQYNDTNTFGGSPLWRDDANTVTQRNGTSAQTFRVYGTYTDASNYERLAINAGVSGDWFQIAAETAGTGADNIGLALSPAGTGAISAHVPDSGTAGGNARGSYAVDLSTASRYTANQVASGDYSVLTGGYRNKASGAKSGVHCGQYNTASGYQSNVGGGVNNTASSVNSFVGGGQSNTSSGSQSTLAGGYGNTASGSRSFIGSGYFNTASGIDSWIAGGRNGSTRGLTAAMAHGMAQRSAVGDRQMMGMPLSRAATTDATPTVLTSDAGTPGAANQVVLPNNSTHFFEVIVVAHDVTNTKSATWKIEGTIRRGANAASTTIVGTNTTTALSSDFAGAPTAAPTATADTTNGALAVTFTGLASTTIYPMAFVRVVQAA